VVQQINSYLSHGGLFSSIEAWVDGVIPWVGVKAMIDEFQVDMHQREEEKIGSGFLPDTTKVTHHKPFYAAEVILKGIDMRAMLATFDEDPRQAVQMTASAQRSNYRAHKDLPTTEFSSAWHDTDDFIETDWSSSDNPSLHLLPVATCPHFTYFKRNSATLENTAQRSKFGIEKSHTCLLGEEPCA
jgi:RNA pol II promoter Fmp27 protein domain